MNTQIELNKRIDEKERIGRDKVLSIYGKYNLTESPSRFDSWDMSGSTLSPDGYKPYFIEVKDREIKSTDYNTALMEYKKFYLLKHVADYHGGDMFYVCTYKDNVMLAFNLNKINLTDIFITIKPSPKNSMVDDKEEVDKIYIELPTHLAKPYNLK